MRRRPRLLTAAAVLAAVTGAVSQVPAASADPLGSARDQATTLARSVHDLQIRAEVASQHYDAVQAQLEQAVSTQVSADEALSAVQGQAQQAATVVQDRARALYESGGSSEVLASLIAGQNPTDAIDRYRLAGAVLAYDQSNVVVAGRAVASARSVERRDRAAAAAVTRLQVSQRQAAAKVTALLDSQRRQLAAVNGTVRRLERIAAAQAAAASAQDFTTAVSQAGGAVALDGSSTVPSQIAAIAIAAAKSRIGDPYVWGATGPAAFDCSGLTQWSYAHAGIQLPRVAAAQWGSGPHPSLAALEPGDLLFWATDTSNPATIHHVTMYLGGGMMVAAPHTGTNVQVQPVYMDGFIGATRPWARS